jgi:hypothetical protein
MSVAANVHAGRGGEALGARVIKLGRVVFAPTSNQHSTVLEQRRGMTGASFLHFRSGEKATIGHIVELGGVERGASRVLTATGD